MNVHTTITRRDSSWREGFEDIIALDDDVACLTDHLGTVVYHMLVAVNTGVFGNLSDAGSTCLHSTALTGSLQPHVGATDNDSRAASKEGAVAVDVTNDNLRG